MRGIVIAVGGAASLMLTAVPAHAGVNLLVNGGFQDPLNGTPALANGGTQTLNANNLSGANANNRIPGWTVTAGRVTISKAVPGAKGSSTSITLSALAGGSQGAIQQTFNTVVGKVYELIFYISRSPNSTVGLNANQRARVANPVATVTLSGPTATDLTQNFTITTATTANAGMQWLRRVTYFKASASQTTLKFAEARDYTVNGTGYAPYIDGVRVIATPEPEALGTMALGLGLAGFLARRRRRAQRNVAAMA